MPVRKIDFKTALRDPKAVFDTPEQVLADPRLDRQGKVSILESWRHDAERLLPAESEAAAEGEQNVLSRVESALKALKEQRHGIGRRMHRGERRRRN